MIDQTPSQWPASTIEGPAMSPLQIAFDTLTATATPPAAAEHIAATDPDPTAVYLLTSGSAGKPRALIQTQPMIAINARAALLERRLRRSRPGYDDYLARTSAFIPWPPKRPQQQGTAS